MVGVRLTAVDQPIITPKYPSAGRALA